MKKNLISLIIAIVLCFSVNAFSQTATPPSNGDGTTANPYQIANLENLYWIAATTSNWSLHYIQTADINAAETYNWFSGAGWVAIGNNSTKFTGTYNGQNFTIDSLRINRTGSYQGLFGYAQNSTIKNLNLTNVNIQGGQYTGGLAGQTDNCNFEKTFASGAISSGNSYIGGLIGRVFGGNIQFCSALVSVNGNNLIGGLLGSVENNAIIFQSHSSATVEGNDNVGGLTGSLSGIINYSYSNGSITGNENVGGLVGYNGAGSLISNCYSHSNVNGNTNVGGFIGKNNNYQNPYPPEATVVQSFCTGQVTGLSSVGGFVGNIYADKSVFFRCFWDTTSSGIATSAGGTEVIAKSTEELKQKATFQNYNFYKLWNIIEGIDYPTFQDLTIYEQPLPLTINDLNGNGTIDDPYLITNANELNTIRLNLSAFYSLANDIDISATVAWNNGQGWLPINFTGNFNGNGFTISHLTVNRPTFSYIGLFGDAQNATILNLNLGNTSVIGKNAACLSGRIRDNNSKVQNVNVSGEVNGISGYSAGLISDFSWGIVSNTFANCNIINKGTGTGGLIGNSYYGHFYYSYSTGSITGYNNVGGLVGYNGAGSLISNCYSHSSVKGNENVGGLVGKNNNYQYPYPSGATVNNSFSTGLVTGNTSIGGFVGVVWAQGSSFNNCYWNTETSDLSYSAGGNGVMGRNTEQMTYPYDANTYNSWNFSTIWNEDIDFAVNFGYPYLAWTDSLTLIETILFAPVDNSQDISLNPSFEWEQINFASYYILQISTDSNFINVIYDLEISDTTFNDIEFEYYTQYFWRIKAANNLVESPWSEIWNFTTIWGANEAEAIFAAGPNLNTARYGHHSASLEDGRLVVFGGHGNNFVSLGSAEVWDPANPNSFTTLNMNYTHDGPTFVELNDGRYLIAGGCSNLGVPAYATSEIFNPANNTFSPVGSMARFRASGGGAELSNGNVLIASAWWTHNTAHTYGELLNQQTQTFSAVGPFSIARSLAIVMPTNDGQAVVLGGSTPTGANLPTNMPIELFNPENSSISTLQSSLFADEDGWHISTRTNYSKEQLMQDGRYLWMAGKSINSVGYRRLFTFDPETKTTAEFVTYPALPNSAIYSLSQPLVDYLRNTAHILAVVPGSGFPVCKVISVDLATGNLTISSNSYNFTYHYGTASVLSDGRIFITGGSSNGSNFNLVNNTTFITPPLYSNNKQYINLNAGWNTISANYLPDEPNLENIFAEMEELVIVKNADGQIFEPAQNINQIGDWNIAHGYMVYVTAPATLQITGTEVNPTETEINLVSGWNLVSYLRNSPLAISSALEGISSSIILVKNNLGQLYYPAFGLNTIGNMQPGQGYWFYMNSNAVLVYPGN